MKQNFYMGMYEGKEWLVAPKYAGSFRVINESGFTELWSHLNYLTNLRPVTVLDIAPDELRDFIAYSDPNPLHDKREIWRTTRFAILDQLAPTTPPNNEVGKVCVTEPNKHGAMVEASYIHYGDVMMSIKWIRFSMTGDIGKWISTHGQIRDFSDLINPILLFEGVEG
jgi:hypothetical protein